MIVFNPMEFINYWPYNFIYAITDVPYDVFMINIPEVYKLLNKLPEREQQLIINRFKNKMTYEELASTENITRERCRQIIRNIINEYKSESILDKIKMTNTIEYRNKCMKIYNLQDKIHDLENQLHKKETDFENDEIQFNPKHIHINSIGLSTRAYNALMRAGVRTLFHLTKMTEQDLMALKNLGTTVLYEIKDKMNEYKLELAKRDISPITDIHNTDINRLKIPLDVMLYLYDRNIDTIGELLKYTEEDLTKNNDGHVYYNSYMIDHIITALEYLNIYLK